LVITRRSSTDSAINRLVVGLNLAPLNMGVMCISQNNLLA